MPKVAIRTPDRTIRAEPTEGSSAGAVETRVYFDGERHPLHLRVHSLRPGARLALNGGQSDLSIYVWKGSVAIEDVELGERSSAIVQRGASAMLIAGAAGSQVLEFSAGGDRASDTGAGGRLLLLPNASVPRTSAMGGAEGVGGALHADARDPARNVWLHENDFAESGKETVLHSHSEDEIIFVRAGSMRLGNRVFVPGTALAIAADTLYGFHSGPDGVSFVNFRACSPTYRTADGSLIMDEAELWRSAVGRPRFLTVARDPVHGPDQASDH